MVTRVVMVTKVVLVTVLLITVFILRDTEFLEQFICVELNVVIVFFSVKIWTRTLFSDVAARVETVLSW